MARSKTSSFILEQKLNTNVSDERELGRRFFIASNMKNRLISHARKQLRKFRNDKEVKALLAIRKERKTAVLSAKKAEDVASAKRKLEEVNLLLAEKRLAYGLSEWEFQKWISVQQQKYRKSIDSDVAQKLASSVWKAVETVLFGNGRCIHFQKLENLETLEGKKNTSGIRYKNKRIEWLGLSIGIQTRKNDVYAEEALTHRVKYCRIVRKPVGTRWHYYVQLVLEGIPPKKHAFMNSGRTGLDQGTSCEACVSDNKCLLTEIRTAADRTKELHRLQRKQDRSLRAMNPDNYRTDGTIKRGKKTWVHSHTYKNTRMRVKTLYRQNADELKQNEEILANEILCTMGSDIITEPMDYDALKKRAKNTEVNEKTGRYKKKKRFGRSIGKHAPSRFLNILQRKLGYIGKEITFVDKWGYRASQYDHTKDKYRKCSINDRWKHIRGAPIQRDLYSAFLLYNMKDAMTIDRERCKRTYRRFHKLHDACIAEMKASGISKPSVFGF